MLSVYVAVNFADCSPESKYPLLAHQEMAAQYFGNDTAWYIHNIPFFECSDKQMEQVYYYRWKLYKAHIRRIGDNDFVITEFINHVAWDRDPYCTINAASMHHIYEGRWLKDSRYMNGYIDYLFHNGGDNRHYSESISDAAYGRYLVSGDKVFLLTQLDSMKRLYSDWNDHFDSARGLYYIPAMPDATEYTIASIDASGGKDGFDDGEAYRPTINSYMYGNAMAIAHVSAIRGDRTAEQEYFKKAAVLKANVEHDLWNDSLRHFCDRFRVNNQYVRYWNFIRGRELAGMIPWYFDLPSDSAKFNSAWSHITDTSELLGPYGLRTNEPSYQYYFKQFVIYQGQRGSQWNGPSWPYQTSQAITAMANLLNDYKQNTVSTSDYVKILRLFTRQHYLPEGKLDLVENYDPNLGGPIVYYYWSNHYNHSSYNNLIISGLCGIRPSESDTLVINPLVDTSIRYFCLDDVLYHGHRLSVVYDADGSKYKIGKGLIVFVDGRKTSLIKHQDRPAVYIGSVLGEPSVQGHSDLALNISRKGFPVPTASINADPDTSIYQAIDGRIWYFSEITNRWTTEGSTASRDWYELDFGGEHQISRVTIYPIADSIKFTAPDKITLEYKKGEEWIPAKIVGSNYSKPIANTENELSVEPISTRYLRINFDHRLKQVAISEIECGN